MKVGLVLEGGGFRGLFTAGILDYFLDQNWHFPYIIGVSMGTVNGANYISKQKGRSIDVPSEFLYDPRYFSYKNLVTKGNLFGMDFIFDEIPRKYNPFDYKTFKESNQEFIITAMDVQFGGSRYFRKDELNESEMLKALRASCSLPFISKMVTFKGKKYLDGGLSDSVPIKKAFEDGVDKIIALVTREEGYRKEEKEENSVKVGSGNLIYRGYPRVIEAIKNRSKTYNMELEYMEEMIEAGKVLAIYPKEPIDMGRTERNKEKLRKCYDDGYKRGKELHREIVAFAMLEED